MIRKMLPVLLLVLGIGAGVGTGLFLRSDPQEHVEVNSCGEVGEEMSEPAHSEKNDKNEEEQAHEYVKLNNQFVVPIVGESKVKSLVVLSLSVEVPTGQRETVFAREPKLRDAFLQVMFDHANMGGFDGAFTQSSNMDVLRNSLLEIAHSTLGELISDVLIVDIARQDV